MGNYDISNETVETIKKEGYEILNPYKPAVEKSGRNVVHIVVKHTLCGKVYETRFDSFIKYHKRCTCSRKRNYASIVTTDDAQRFIESKFGKRYKLISSYIGRKKPITVLDTTTSEKLYIPALERLLDPRLKTLKNYYRNGNKLQLWQDRIDEACINKFGEKKFKVLYFDVKDSKHSDFLCLKCGETFHSDFQTLKKNCRCMKCENLSRKDLNTELVRKEIEELDPDYKMLGEYEHTHKPFLVKHMLCGNEYYVSRTNFLRGRRCPHCKASLNEKVISEILEINNIKYIQQYKINECKHVNVLPFDFYIPDFDVIIEYDGEFHYKPVISEENFKRQKETDKIKNKFCKDNKIKLLRIPYWQKDNINTILTSMIKLNNKRISYTKFEKWRISLNLRNKN